MDYDIDDYVAYIDPDSPEGFRIGKVQCILIGKYEIAYFIDGEPYFESEIVYFEDLGVELN